MLPTNNPNVVADNRVPKPSELLKKLENLDEKFESAISNLSEYL
jgi:hypothetical protein